MASVISNQLKIEMLINGIETLVNFSEKEIEDYLKYLLHDFKIQILKHNKKVKIICTEKDIFDYREFSIQHILS